MNGGSPLVRPWLKAGLNVLLVDDEARALELRGPSNPTAPARPDMPAPRPGKPAPNFDDARFARPAVSDATRTVSPASRPAPPQKTAPPSAPT
ncbi:MAG: hypothetical protein IJY48_03145, partial [Mailhella sp.]|nr:hypothetical protein [Mailhella sp.]